MSSVFKALQQFELERRGTTAAGNRSLRPLELIADSVEQDITAPPQFASLQPATSSESLVVAMLSDNSLGAEKFRMLSTRLRHLQQGQSLKKVVLTSSGTGEGKSLIAANLAATLARSQRVLLLEGDMRRPTLSRLFGLGDLKGLSDYLADAEPISQVVYRLEPLQLYLLPAGNVAKDPMQLLESPRLAELMKDLTTSFDWIIIDSPPLLPLADTSVWARLADGLLLVVRGDQTSKALLQKSVESMNGSLLGIVLNEFPEQDQQRYTQSYPSEGDAEVNEGNKEPAVIDGN